MDASWLDAARLVVVLVLIALNAYFVAAEFALVTVRWTRVEQLVEARKFGALAIQRAIENLDDSIAACQLGITLASLALGWIGEPALAHLLTPVFGAIPGPWDAAVSHAVAVGVAYLMLTYLHVVLGEQAPKALAIQRSEDVALFVTVPLLTFSRVCRPFIRAIGGSSNFVIRLLRLPPLAHAKTVHSVDELQMLVEETEEAGVIPADQATYVQNVFELSEKTVRDVMIPRDKVVMLSLRMSSEEVLEVCRDTAHTRMPVWDGTPDNIVGVVNTKNLFHLLSLRGLVVLMDAMYEPIYVSAELSLARLLRIFKRVRRPMAVVQGDDGKFLGIVTLEDILEEIVGEIEDEHDAPGGTAVAAPPGAATTTGTAPPLGSTLRSSPPVSAPASPAAPAAPPR